MGIVVRAAIVPPVLLLATGARRSSSERGLRGNRVFHRADAGRPGVRARHAYPSADRSPAPRAITPTSIPARPLGLPLGQDPESRLWVGAGFYDGDTKVKVRFEEEGEVFAGSVSASANGFQCGVGLDWAVSRKVTMRLDTACSPM